MVCRAYRHISLISFPIKDLAANIMLLKLYLNDLDLLP